MICNKGLQNVCIKERERIIYAQDLSHSTNNREHVGSNWNVKLMQIGWAKRQKMNQFPNQKFLLSSNRTKKNIIAKAINCATTLVTFFFFQFLFISKQTIHLCQASIQQPDFKRHTSKFQITTTQALANRFKEYPSI